MNSKITTLLASVGVTLVSQCVSASIVDETILERDSQPRSISEYSNLSFLYSFEGNENDDFDRVNGSCGNGGCSANGSC
jgi:hypothetical protein